MKPQARGPGRRRENREEEEHSPRLAERSLHVPRGINHQCIDCRSGDLVKLPPPQCRRLRGDWTREGCLDLMAAIRLLLAERGEPCLEMLEIGDQFLCRLVAVEWILAEAGCDNSVELRRTLGLHAGEGRRVLLDDPGNGRRYGRCHERIDACSQLVEHQAKREEVSPKVDGSARRLLRRQIGRSSEDDACLRQSWVSVATESRT